MRRRRATVAVCDSSDTWWMAMRSGGSQWRMGPTFFKCFLFKQPYSYTTITTDVETDQISVSFLVPNMRIFDGFGQFLFRLKMHFSVCFFFVLGPKRVNFGRKLGIKRLWSGGHINGPRMLWGSLDRPLPLKWNLSLQCCGCSKESMGCCWAVPSPIWFKCIYGLCLW